MFLVVFVLVFVFFLLLDSYFIEEFVYKPAGPNKIHDPDESQSSKHGNIEIKPVVEELQSHLKVIHLNMLEYNAQQLRPLLHPCD